MAICLYFINTVYQFEFREVVDMLKEAGHDVIEWDTEGHYYDVWKNITSKLNKPP